MTSDRLSAIGYRLSVVSRASSEDGKTARRRVGKNDGVANDEEPMADRQEEQPW